jgi:hypothetical protein
LDPIDAVLTSWRPAAVALSARAQCSTPLMTQGDPLLAGGCGARGVAPRHARDADRTSTPVMTQGDPLAHGAAAVDRCVPGTLVGCAQRMRALLARG